MDAASKSGGDALVSPSTHFLKTIAHNSKEIVVELRTIRKLLQKNNSLQELPGDPDNES